MKEMAPNGFALKHALREPLFVVLRETALNLLLDYHLPEFTFQDLADTAYWKLIHE
jgi:hypothetical protein